MRGFPKPIMIGLAQAIMIACGAALGTPLRGEGDSVPFYPLAFGDCERTWVVRGLAATYMGDFRQLPSSTRRVGNRRIGPSCGGSPREGATARSATSDWRRGAAAP